MKRYEGLFILDLAGREEGLKEAVEKVKSILAAAGAKVELVREMEKRPFARVTDKKVTAGYYVHMAFEATKPIMAGLRSKFLHIPEVYRVEFNHASKTPWVPTPAAEPAAR